MNKLTLLSRLILFLTSYIPLGIIFLIIDFRELIYPFFKNPFISFSLIVFTCILIVLLLTFLKYFKNKSSPIESMKIINVQNMDGEILAYIFTYILPFLGFPTEKQFPISLFLLIVIGILYIKSDMIGINPILAFFGFHILKVEWTKDGWKKSKEVVLISKEDYFILKHSEIISTIQIEKNLYLLKEISNG
ncbi:MAG: hypothetical protein NTX65_04940 [Ignavibacteriales bacterium]|nr:hypothetical protein [Ignavibacteriales bacterium]